MIAEFALAALLSCDPRLTALFAPLRPVLGQYQVCTTPDSLDDVVSAETAAGAHASPAELQDPSAAFGAAGLYDRGALLRLYGGRRARVVRAWREKDGRFEALTIISPYPDVEFTKLVEGTLVRILTLDLHQALGARR